MKFEFDDWLLILGMLLIAVGAALVYIPAGVIVAGMELVGFAYLIRAEKERHATAE